MLIIWRVMSDSLGFLITDVSRLMRKHFDERARLLGTTRAQWRTLFILSRNEGIHQGGLADLLEVEPITVCRMIDRLEESGLVERRRDPADRRAWRIHMTDAAKPLLARLRALSDDMLEVALDGIDAPERAALAGSLHRIHQNILNSDSTSEIAHG